MDPNELFKRVIHVQQKHITFLDATQKNLSYYLFGKNVDLYKRLTIPRINVRNIMNATAPQPDNPLQSIVGAFTDEIAVSEFRTTVKPYPLEGKEPYSSYADMLEQQLEMIHKKSGRRSQLRAATFELLAHGYFGLYFDGDRYHFLTAYDLIPGDPNIIEAQAQPFIIRKTQVNRATLEAAGVDTTNEQGVYLYEWAQSDDLEMFTLYDVYVKHSDQNIGFTQKGTVVYNQEMSYPKRYPISIANTSEILGSFYTVPTMTQLTQKLIDYQKANASIKESSSSIAKPILTYDSDAGIDVDALHRSLKMGYKHIIVGKNKEGDINFKAPGSLPNYAQILPDKIEEDIMKHLGLNKTFMGLPNVGARERGALARLLKTSFRKLSTISSIIEESFNEIDQYILDYMSSHTMTYEKRTGINIEEIFAGPVKYIADEKFIAYSSEDSLEKKSFVMNQWKSKLISTRQALEEMGERQPSKSIDMMREEAKDNQEFAINMQKAAQTQQTTSTLDQVSNRLLGQLVYKFWISPVADDRVLVKVHASEMDRVAFLLSDFSNRVLLESYVEDIPAPITQTDPTIPEAQPEIPTSVPTGTEGADPNAQPVTPPTNPDGSLPKVEPSLKTAEPQQPTPTVATKTEEPKTEEPVPATAIEDNGTFNPKELEAALSRSKVIYDPNKYMGLPGMYLVEPHARWVFTGRKMALVMGRDYSEYVNKPMLFAGNDVYGVIVLKKVIKDFDFKATQKYHLVSPKERKKWWGDNPVYMYIFEFYPFKFTKSYKKTAGQTTFFGKVEFTDEDAKPNSQEEDVVAKSKEPNVPDTNQDPSPATRAKEDQVTLDKAKNTPRKDLGKPPVVPVSPLSS